MFEPVKSPEKSMAMYQKEVWISPWNYLKFSIGQLYWQQEQHL